MIIVYVISITVHTSSMFIYFQSQKYLKNSFDKKTSKHYDIKASQLYITCP